MLNSLKLYSKYFLKSAYSPARKYVIHDMNRFGLKYKGYLKDHNFSDKERKAALDKAISWLMSAQKAGNDGGMGSFHLTNKWTPSYPETTGYIIPTLIDYYKKYDNPEVLASAIKAADFLVKIQKTGGGWQGGRIGENRPEIVFNTGQVIRGMIASYEQTENKIYLDAAIRAGNWLAQIQHREGFWKTNALMNTERVYDTFVDTPLLQLFKLTGDESFRKSAVLNLDWVINKKMADNGWFEDCDNTIKRNDRPILHTIAYTLDGLIDSGLILNEAKYIEAAVKGAKKLRDLFLFQGFLQGRFNKSWHGSEHMICTGGAQMAIIWLKLFNISGEKLFPEAAEKMLDLLIFIQSRNIPETSDTLGALPGSFPLWGRYEPFAFPNWATKFFCDALLLEEEIVK
jgi:rhamnogalacturonyl hydrolase YesR